MGVRGVAQGQCSRELSFTFPACLSAMSLPFTLVRGYGAQTSSFNTCLLSGSHAPPDVLLTGAAPGSETGGDPCPALLCWWRRQVQVRRASETCPVVDGDVPGAASP